MKVPAMYLKRIWTPLEWFGISFFKDQEDGRYYYKKQGGNLKRFGKALQGNFDIYVFEERFIIPLFLSKELAVSQVQEDVSHILPSTHTFRAGGQAISAHMQQLAKQAFLALYITE